MTENETQCIDAEGVDHVYFDQQDLRVIDILAQGYQRSWRMSRLSTTKRLKSIINT